MNEPIDDGALPDDDPVLDAAGARLRAGSPAISPATVEVAALRRRSRNLAVAAGACLAAVVVLAGTLVVQARSGGDDDRPPLTAARPSPAQVDTLLASLPAEPVDPTKVQLVSTVSTYSDCSALIGDLRKVGAEHVGSRGFGDSYGIGFTPVAGVATKGFGQASDSAATGERLAYTGPASDGAGTTLGTNVQVAGVDELDFAKAAGKLIYDLDGRGNLRITDAATLQVIATLDVTPHSPRTGREETPRLTESVSQLLVADGRVAVFGSEVETSKPIPGDPSATRASTTYLTVTFVDATNPVAPKVTDRVRVEGSLVSARLVDGQIRLVTTSNLADLGFVLPTTPNSVAKALDQNRRSVATSSVADWIPDWQRDGQDPQPLVPCDRVHVPETFAGVAMTSMVAFPIGTGRFDPAGTSILAPGTTLYAGLDTVAVSSEVWVDPVDRDRLEFDDWQTAVHEFSFGGGAAPAYEGSAIVDGSTVGQFAFGEIGDSLAVVTTKGTPWKQQPDVAVDLTVLSKGSGKTLAETAKIADLADGDGAVTAVRFVPGRVLISTGAFGRKVQVIDVRKPDAPRRAGSVTVPGDVGYFHPLPDDRALLVGSRYDEVGTGRDKVSRSWVQASILDTSNPDAPAIVSTWERPWSADEVGSDHHAFTYWPERKLAMWGIRDTQWQANQQDRPNHAAVLDTAGAVREVAVPTANEPPASGPPCPAVTVTDEEARRMIPAGGVVIRCGDPATESVDWPRYQCSRVDDGLVARFVPKDQADAAFFVCSPAPPPAVARVLVVGGTPILLTDQTLERLDPTTFASTAVAFHPTSSVGIAY